MKITADKIHNAFLNGYKLHKEIYIGYPEYLWRDAIKHKLLDDSFTFEMIDKAIKENNPILQKYMGIIYYVDLPLGTGKRNKSK